MLPPSSCRSMQDPAPEGYRINHVHRKITVDGPTRGGGLAIISRDSIPVLTHPLASSFDPTSFELQLTLVGSGPSTFILMNVYRPPLQSKSVFIEKLLDIISTITATSGNDRLLICGDVTFLAFRDRRTSMSTYRKPSIPSGSINT